MEKQFIIPKKGKSLEQVQDGLKAFKAMDTSDLKGKFTVYMHSGGKELEIVRRAAYDIYNHSNAMLGSYEQGVKQMQEEVLSMACHLLNGGDDARANITTGGTESIFCAVHAAREWAKENKPVPNVPEIVIPYSGHAAFDKACHYQGLKIVRVAVGEDFRADIGAMRKAVNENTIAIVGSAPCWPYGVIDPISALAEIALEHNLWFHVDCCVGGYINPWLEKLGYPISLFDFRVKGVCSISADLHKHGYAAKPCSTVLYRNEMLQKYHWVEICEWPCGSYKTNGFVGSRPAFSVASAWAVMNYLGEDGYTKLAKRSMEVKEKLIAGIESIADLKCLCNDTIIVYYRSETLNMFSLIAAMVSRGYFPLGIFDPVFIQMTAEPVDDYVIEAYLKDLRDAVEDVKNGKVNEEILAMYI